MQIIRIAVQVLLAITLLHRIQAEPIHDPIRDFLETPDLDRDIAVPDMKEFSKLELDIVGDGKKVICLSAYGDRSGDYWTVYLPVPGGYKAARTTAGDRLIGFSTEKFYVGYIDEIKRRGILTYRGRIRTGFALEAYWISGNRLLHKEIGVVKVEEGGKSPPLLEKYFPESRNPKSPLNPVQRITIDDLKVLGYSIPKPAK